MTQDHTKPKLKHRPAGPILIIIAALLLANAIYMFYVAVDQQEHFKRGCDDDIVQYYKEQDLIYNPDGEPGKVVQICG